MNLEKGIWYKYHNENYKCMRDQIILTPQFNFYYLDYINKRNQLNVRNMNTKDIIKLNPKDHPELYL